MRLPSFEVDVRGHRLSMRPATEREVVEARVAIQLRAFPPHRLVGSRFNVILELIPMELVAAEMTVALAAWSLPTVADNVLAKARATIAEWNAALDARADQVLAHIDPRIDGPAAGAPDLAELL